MTATRTIVTRDFTLASLYHLLGETEDVEVIDAPDWHGIKAAVDDGWLCLDGPVYRLTALRGAFSTAQATYPVAFSAADLTAEASVRGCTVDAAAFAVARRFALDHQHPDPDAYATTAANAARRLVRGTP